MDRHDPVFRDDAGRPMSRQRMNVQFKRVCEAAGIGRDWQRRETRHSFVSIAPDSGVPVEDIADAVDTSTPMSPAPCTGTRSPIP